MIAETHRSEGNYDQAIEEFTAIINRSPGVSKWAPDYNRRGQSYQGKGDFDRAMADFDEAIRLKPDFPEAYFNRCDTLRRMGKLDRALSGSVPARLHLDACKKAGKARVFASTRLHPEFPARIIFIP
jgi:tetratricopeptide (TPR) repeat protein